MTERTISIPIPSSKFLELAAFLKEQGSDRDPVDTIGTAIDYWMENASWKQEDLLPEIYDKDKGYWWKTVFLPHGTNLRMKYRGEYYYAQVEGDKILFEEKKGLSPGQIANQVTKSSRNAWRDFEIKRPGDDYWNLATVLRKELRELTLEDLLRDLPPEAQANVIKAYKEETGQ